MKKKKILYLSADYGQGHNSAVQAVIEALDKHHPEEFEHEIIDAPALISPSADKLSQFLYDKSMAYAKPSYRALFKLTDKIVKNNPDTHLYPIAKEIIKPIFDKKPDIIFVCYPIFLYDLARYKRENNLDVPIAVLVTDTGEVHCSWISKEVDYYFVPSDTTAFYLEKMGVEGSKINTFGFPVKQKFYKKWNLKKGREDFDVKENNKVIVYFPGALGVGKVKEKVMAIDGRIDSATIFVICGKNSKLLKEIKKSEFKNTIVPLGFVENMAELLAIADLVVSKAGGISTMEIITMKKPIIITEINPGQEEPNARFIESMGFGYVEKNPDKMAETVDYIFRYDLERLKTNLKNYHVNEHSDRMIANFIKSLV